VKTMRAIAQKENCSESQVVKLVTESFLTV
jgi:hypothetical protein